MPTVQDVIRTITIKGDPQNVDATTAAVNRLKEAVGATATVTDTVTKSSLSVETAYQRQTQRLDENARMQAKASGEIRIANAALAQGIISSTEHAARIDQINQKYAVASPLVQSFTRALSGVQGQLVALAAGAGPVGVFLAGLGPAGIAGGVALGLIKEGLFGAVEMADALGAKAVQLQLFAETTGLTTTQIQALTHAAAEHGVQADQVITSVQRFTAAWEDMRNGGGKLLDEIRKIDVSLADQMQRTTDASKAFDLLARAIAKADAAGNISQRNALARAAGGRGGIGALTGISAAVDAAGGLNGLAATTTGTILDPALLARVSALRAEIEVLRNSSRDVFASIFSVQVLEAELSFEKTLFQIAQHAQNFTLSGDWRSLLFILDKAAAVASFATNPAAAVGAVAGRLVGAAVGDKMRTRTPEQLIDDQVGPPPAYPPQLNMAGMPSPQGALAPQAIAQQWKDLVSALGSAATASDRMKAKQAELYALAQSGKITWDTYWKAVSGEEFAQSSAALNTRIGLLGPAASLTELLQQKENQLTEARKQGTSFTKTETDTMLADVAARKQAADQSILQSNNVATADGLRATKLAELNVLMAQGKLTQDQLTQSMQAYENVIRQTIQQQEIAKSQFPSLKQAELQAGDLRYQLDQLGTSEINTFASGIVDATFSTDKFSISLQKLGVTAIKTLDEMIVKMSLMQTLSPILQGVFGIATPAPSAPINIVGGAGSLPVPTFADGGIIPAGGLALVSEHSPGGGRLMRAGDEPIMVTPNSPAGGSASPISVTYAPVYHVQGSGEEIDRLRAEIARDRQEAPTRMVEAMREAQKRRLLQ